MSDMRIRVARLDDAAAIAKVYVETWRSAYAGLVPDEVLTGMSESRQRRQWKAQIASGDTVMVAEHPEHGIVGMGSTESRDHVTFVLPLAGPGPVTGCDHLLDQHFGSRGAGCDPEARLAVKPRCIDILNAVDQISVTAESFRQLLQTV